MSQAIMTVLNSGLDERQFREIANTDTMFFYESESDIVLTALV